MFEIFSYFFERATIWWWNWPWSKPFLKVAQFPCPSPLRSLPHHNYHRKLVTFNNHQLEHRGTRFWWHHRSILHRFGTLCWTFSSPSNSLFLSHIHVKFLISELLCPWWQTFRPCTRPVARLSFKRPRNHQVPRRGLVRIPLIGYRQLESHHPQFRNHLHAKLKARLI